MEYIKGSPYFCAAKDQIKQYPYLKNNLNCEILIIGGGIDGAIANYYLSQSFNVALVDKARFGYGCTSCATALLEYQLDEFANDIKETMPEEDIIAAYKMGLSSIDKIDKFILEHGNHCQFSRRPTFLYTNSASDVKDIETEYNFRKQNGLECTLYTENNNPFTFPIKAGIFCEDGGAEFNPYLFAKQMIENSKNQQQIFENTHIQQLIKMPKGYKAITNFGEEITCKKVLIATGFNWELLNKDDLCERFISYSIVTEPIKNFTWHKKALIHDVVKPYHYLRLLPDNRIIFGGEDTKYKGKPINANKAAKKYEKLEKDLFELFPNIKGTKIDHKFCGAFGTTNNNMGLIGTSTINNDILLFISCGANGIINAMSGIDIIINILNGKSHPLSHIFDPKNTQKK